MTFDEAREIKRTEHITLKKLRNKARAEKLKERYKQDYRERNGGMVVPIQFDVFLEKIQGIPKEKVDICLEHLSKNIVQRS